MHASIGSKSALEAAQKSWSMYLLAMEPWREAEYADAAQKATKQFEDMMEKGSHFEIDFTDRDYKKALHELKKEVGTVSNALDKINGLSFGGSDAAKDDVTKK